MPSTDQIALIKRARLAGYFNHEIAAYLNINQGRVAEVNTGKIGGMIAPATGLPADFPPHGRGSRLNWPDPLPSPQLTLPGFGPG